LLENREYQEAVDHFKLVKTIKPEQAFSYYHGLAYSYWRLQKLDEAQKAGEGARKHARGVEETATAEDMLRAVASERERLAGLTQHIAAQPATEQAAVRPVNQTGPGDARPTMHRSAPQDTRKLIVRSDPPSPPKPAVHGVLQQIDCLGKVVRLRVVADGKRVSLAITDPQAVVIKGSSTAALDLTCGPQKSENVTLEYEPHADAQIGTIGIVKSLEFQ
jgi:hypothetical protein